MTLLWFLAACSTIVALVAGLRARAARRGSGQLAQVRFRRMHGARVAALLGGELDPRAGSPWIAISVAGRPARMVAAPLDRAETLQAGIELLEHPMRVQVWHTGAHADEPAEVELGEGVERDAVAPVVAALRELGVDSCTSADLSGDYPHLVRARFASVDALPGLIAGVGEQVTRLMELSASAADDAPSAAHPAP